MSEIEWTDVDMGGPRAEDLEETPMGLADQLFAYEMGEMESEDDVIALFQALVDNGWAWSLQGHYGQVATQLIKAGLVSR